MITDSARRACIFCNGQLSNPAKVKQIAKDCDLLIAADGGARYLVDIGLTPQVIIGDMDSVDSDMWKNNRGIEHIRHPIDKDKSDAELAVEYALGNGCGQVILVAATGGRFGHILGNVALIASHPEQVALFDGTSTLIANEWWRYFMSNDPLSRSKTEPASQSKINVVQENPKKRESNHANVRI